ncbi:hypothetical protein [Streptomyces sp. NPDC056987]|uniref:hypothetical protein n=1 Tax=Streptomyces sp. NPDC056987 TaxID=3345988 RepID=UPI003640F2B7
MSEGAALKHTVTTYDLPGEMTGTGEIRNGFVHLRVVAGVEATASSPDTSTRRSSAPTSRAYVVPARRALRTSVARARTRSGGSAAGCRTDTGSPRQAPRSPSTSASGRPGARQLAHSRTATTGPDGPDATGTATNSGGSLATSRDPTNPAG